MTTDLYIGDYAYSSWSMRAWLLFDAFDLPVNNHMIDFSLPEPVSDRVFAVAPPARTVPTAVFSDGAVAWESAAIVEEMASRFPEAGILPNDPKLRCLARSLIAQMHAGFGVLREDCPMNLRVSYRNVPISDGLRANLDRLNAVWEHAIETSGGPWLCGAYSAADAYFAPVVGRIAGYSLPVSKTAQAYVDHHLQDPSFRRWRALGLTRGADLAHYALPYDQRDWPVAPAAQARAVDAGPSVNATCPYSGGPVKDFMEYDGRIWGLCNPGCRDKTVSDPEAWPAFMAMVAAA